MFKSEVKAQGSTLELPLILEVLSPGEGAGGAGGAQEVRVAQGRVEGPADRVGQDELAAPGVAGGQGVRAQVPQGLPEGRAVAVHRDLRGDVEDERARAAGEDVLLEVPAHHALHAPGAAGPAGRVHDYSRWVRI